MAKIRGSVLTATVGLILLAGCSLLPVGGPESWDIRGGQRDPQGLRYALVQLTPKVVDVLATNLPRLASVFPDRSPPKDITFGVGDRVSVTVFEAAAGGLFIPAEASVRPGNFVTLPDQLVDSKGDISIPYAGDVRAAGRTQVQVQQEIVEKLKNRAIEPQAVVSLVDQRTSLISVLGDVGTPSRFAASHAPEHILDAIARAGGPKNQGYDEWIMLERHGKRALAPFGALLYEPVNNIYVHADDVIFLYREPQTFTAFGAVGAIGVNGGQFPFDAWRISLAEAVAKAGGLNDVQADPASVFLYRGETRDVAAQLGVDCSKFDGPIIPIIYNVNLRNPAGYFLATKFEMRSKDAIYISNSVSYEATKAINFFQTLINGVNSPIYAAINAYTLKTAITGVSPTTAIITTPVTTTTTTP